MGEDGRTMPTDPAPTTPEATPTHRRPASETQAIA